MMHEHHRKLRSQGGGDEPVNKLVVPDEIHTWIHEHPAEAQQLGWIVPSWEDPANVSVVIPEFLKLKRPTVARDENAPRKPKTSVQIKVPKKNPDGGEFTEDGGAILDTLIQGARERLVPEMGWDDDVPAYFVLAAVLHDWLTN